MSSGSHSVRLVCNGVVTVLPECHLKAVIEHLHCSDGEFAFADSVGAFEQLPGFMLLYLSLSLSLYIYIYIYICMSLSLSIYI